MTHVFDFYLVYVFSSRFKKNAKNNLGRTPSPKQNKKLIFRSGDFGQVPKPNGVRALWKARTPFVVRDIMRNSLYNLIGKFDGKNYL